MSGSSLKEPDDSFPSGDMSEVEKQRFDYAWKWFNYHASQRMQLFNFFLIITGILANAYVGAYEKGTPLMRFAVSLIGTLQAFGFFVFDVRNRELTRYAEDVLEKIERDKLFPDDYRSPEINNGQTLGLLRQESNSKMREGFMRERRWKNFRKMKVWIRSIEVIVGLVFLIGLVVAISQMISSDSSLEKPAMTNYGGATPSPTIQGNIKANSAVDSTQGNK
jgi:hypothetical protein